MFEALFKNLAEKISGIQISRKNNSSVLFLLLCVSKSHVAIVVFFYFVFSSHAGDLTRPGQGPANMYKYVYTVVNVYEVLFTNLSCFVYDVFDSSYFC